MAVDRAIMVLDSASGIEPKTKKLFAVCRNRKVPIMACIHWNHFPQSTARE